MNAELPGSVAEPASGWLGRSWRDWEKFWFRPADPTRLGLMRIGTGLVVLFTFFCYGLDLQPLLGEHGWIDLPTRLRQVRDGPNELVPFSASPPKAPPPSNPEEERYYREYVEMFHEAPPAPYPRNDAENKYCIKFREHFKVDLRNHGMPIPRGLTNDPVTWSAQTWQQVQYLQDFAAVYQHKFGVADAPTPPYPRDDAEKRAIFEYLDRYGIDLHRLAYRGEPAWSLWFYVTDPAAMQFLQAVVLFTALLFTLGCCTRITAPLTWLFNLSYFFRMPYALFGADTVMNIMLFYLMLAPCDAALSVDRLIACWWSRNKLAVVNRWRGFRRQAALSAQDLRPSTFQPTPPATVGANIVLRLVQLHLCMIYLIAGLTKLSATAWWNGTGIWPILAQPELAPIRFDFYNDFLRFLAGNGFLFFLFLFAGTMFTLFFEIGYPFLIWTRLRRPFLVAAVLMHVMIGITGLPTFAVIMLVMNAAFLTDAEAHWFAGIWQRVRLKNVAARK